jgi:7,8-dihydropterin-6-yl-methyl-4-(beta-D-ribofuranosyl)aminobenzene 5'-phosphate synthase
MRIVNLIENTEGVRGCAFAHGLSFYIETGKHKLLVDLGPSEVTLENASKLGIDLGAVDIVILSHGHYDHSGGIISFSRINKHADIYMQRLAAGNYYSDNGEKEGSDRYRYIGIDKEIKDLPQVRYLDGDYVIDDEISVFVMDEPAIRRPFTNFRLKEKVDGAYIQDEFRHEQYVVITEGNRKILISGCAHNGILNILGEYERKYAAQPDAVISGFHLMKKSGYTDDEITEIIDTAKRLKEYRTIFYTCHCTGVEAYESMRCIMGDQLRYVHSGEEIRLKYEKSAQGERRNGL